LEDIDKLDDPTLRDLSLIAAETIVSCNHVLPSNNKDEPFEPAPYKVMAYHLKKIQHLEPMERSIQALAHDSLFLFRHFACPMPTSRALQAIFYPLTEENFTRFNEWIFWYWAELAETQHENTGAFWLEVFADLVNRQHFMMAFKWTKIEMTRLTKRPLKDLPVILHRWPITINWLDPKFITFQTKLSTLIQ
jgi:hypothetical protein